MTKQRALDAIAQEIELCKICRKGKVGKAVPGEGKPNAKIVLLGEAPGKTEALSGRPFVGRAGKLLRGILKDIGVAEDEVFITSPVKYLPKYVTPTLKDIEHGNLHLQKQLNVIKPKVIVLMGKTAVQAVLNRAVAIAKVHGTLVKDHKRTYLITYHPAAPLHSPKVRADLVADFKHLKKLFLQHA